VAMNRSLRVRLTFLYTSFFALLFVLSGFLLYGTLSRSLHSRLNETLASEADTAAGLFDEEFHEMAGRAGVAAQVVVMDMKVRDTVVAVMHGDRVLASSNGVAAADLTHGNRRVVEREVNVDGDTYRVLIGASLDGIAAELAVVRRALAVGILIALLLSGMGAWLLATHTLRPLRSMAEQARAITDQNLDTRIQVADAAAELEIVIASFNDLLSRLDRSFDSMRRFVADASHELRTPISVIRGEADVALSRERPATEYKASLSTILEESRHLSKLVDDLLNLARADSGYVQLQNQEFYLNELLTECCRSVRKLAEARKLTLNCLPAADLQYRGDEQLLRRLILNLLDNAIRYTPEGGLITVALEANPEGVRIRVADTGIGIPPEHMSQVFERFYRADEARSRTAGGAGLGLPIVKWIAEAHRGIVECASAPGVGSTFTVTLPR
jgi:two-component system, OmpR family, sensor kinase